MIPDPPSAPPFNQRAVADRRVPVSKSRNLGLPEGFGPFQGLPQRSITECFRLQGMALVSTGEMDEVFGIFAS